MFAEDQQIFKNEKNETEKIGKFYYGNISRIKLKNIQLKNDFTEDKK